MTEQSDKKRIDLKTTQIAAGSMASVTSAVAASQLGVAGTLVGAGVGSVVGTVAGAVYEHYLDRTHRQMRLVVPRIGVTRAPTSDDGQTPWTWLRSRRLALALTAAGGLGIAILALTGFEAVTGQPVSAGKDSGTSIGQVFGGGSADNQGTESSTTPSPEVTPREEPTSVPSADPSSSPTTSAPTSTPQPSPSPTTEPD